MDRKCVCVVFFSPHTMARLVFSIRVTQDGFSKVGKQHGCPLYTLCLHISQDIRFYLSVHTTCMHMHTHTLTHTLYILPSWRTCERVRVSAHVFAPTWKSRQRSVTIFNKWISHRSIRLTGHIIM